jgi:hypothetical protein
MTGESGGGTQTFLASAVDDRIAVAAPVNMISLHMQGGCLCENLPNLRLDTNNVEIAATIAPRPLLMVSATGDWTNETLELEFPEVRRFYALFGAEDRVAAVRFQAEHNYNRDSREAMYAWMNRWLKGGTGDRITEKPFHVDPLAKLLVFHNRSLPANAVTATQLTEQWIAAATRQFATTDPAVRRAALAHAIGFADRSPAVATPRSARRTVLLASPNGELETLLRHAGFVVVPVQFTRFDADAAEKIDHFDTYNRTAASQRVADIVAAMDAYPGASIVADGDAALAALLAGAVTTFDRAVLDVNRFDPSTDAPFVEHLYIPGIRRAGDLQTAASQARGTVVVHNAGDRFDVTGIRVEARQLTPQEIVAALQSRPAKGRATSAPAGTR